MIGCALLFRLLAASDYPLLSTDVYRYSWDGRVQRAGVNPYRYPPADEALAELRDADLHPRINRPGARTVYPPGAQVIFRLLPYSLDAARGAMIACDLATILLLAWLLARLGQDPSRVVIYAWAPLVVLEIGNGGHLEAAMLPLLVGSVIALRAGRAVGAGWLLGGAAAIKLYPLLAAVALGRRRPVAVLAPALGLMAALYLIYGWSVGPRQVLGFLPRYVGSAEDHNVGLRAVLEWLLSPALDQPRGIAFGICLALLAGGAWWVGRAPAPIELRLLRLVGIYLITLPTAFHPWYALWLIPWLCFHPRASWLWLTAALPLSYLKFGSPGGEMPPWVIPLEWVPVGALLLWEARRAQRAMTASSQGGSAG